MKQNPADADAVGVEFVGFAVDYLCTSHRGTGGMTQVVPAAVIIQPAEMHRSCGGVMVTATELIGLSWS